MPAKRVLEVAQLWQEASVYIHAGGVYEVMSDIFVTQVFHG